MDNEDELWRPAPLRPYQLSNVILKIPADGITATLQLLQKAGRLESGLFWYGTRDSVGNGAVEYVVAPRQRMSWGNFHVSTQAMTEMAYRVPEQLKLLAQVHSHPGIRVEHSNYDDRMIGSKKALSLVFPRYGHLTSPFPLEVGVHEWQSDYWHLLDASNARRRVIAVQGKVKAEDLR